MTDYELARAIVRKMIDEFEKMPEEEKLAFAIITIYMDFEILLPDYLKKHPTIYHYYEFSKGNVHPLLFDPEIKEFCQTKCNPLAPKWKEMFGRIKKEMIESGESDKYKPPPKTDAIYINCGRIGRPYK